MTRKKIKFSHTKWLLPLWILLIGSIVLYMIAHAVQQDDSRHIRTLAELNAVTYGDNMIADLNAGINITDTLEQILISTDGRIDKFDIIADRMMADYVRSIQVAPGGIVTDIYPAEGNEAGKIDLIHDKYRGETVNTALPMMRLSYMVLLSWSKEDTFFQSVIQFFYRMRRVLPIFGA